MQCRAQRISFRAWSDWLPCRYRSGIWRDHSNATIEDIDHDVEVVGWGEEDGVKFWHIRNSWGTFWGEMGFFKLERSKDALFIENGDCW